MPRLLFIAAHRLNRSPSQRFRFEQFLPFLEANGWEWELSALLDEADDKAFYRSGNFLDKLHIVRKSFARRKQDVRRSREFDAIFIQREAFMTGTTQFEKGFRKAGCRIIFDFDDAIWLPNVSEGNRRFNWLKRPSKTAEIIRYADQVIAGNNFLADYARRYHQNVTIIPTTIDTRYHARTRPVRKEGPLCIGWTGSHTTIKHFEQAVPVLKELKTRFGDRVTFKVIGDPAYQCPELGIVGWPWKPDTEISDLEDLDIGIMPLPDDDWSKGKCGLKGLQYMALEIPPVMSAVGVNTEIVQNGVNGFLPGNEREWIDQLSALIQDSGLRIAVGKRARDTVEKRYSLESQKFTFLQVLNNPQTP